VQLKLSKGSPDLVAKVRVMGIANITPDSFSDGGRFTALKDIIGSVQEMIAAGADIIDVGGESTRPFSEPVDADVELARTIPVIRAIRQFSSIPISIDTTKAEVAAAAIEAGADIVNDVSALRFDPDMATIVRASGLPVILMHMRGRPRDMQKNPYYEDLLGEVAAFFKERIEWAEKQGISRERVVIDPGIGFGKTVAHNLALLKHLAFFKTLGCPILIGHSRKAFIGKILDKEVGERDVATAALSALCVGFGANILRVHDVAKTVQAVRLAEAVLSVTTASCTP